MNSPITGQPMVLRTEKRTVNYKGQDFTIDYTFWWDDAIQDGWEDEEQTDNALTQVYQQYKASNNDPLFI